MGTKVIHTCDGPCGSELTGTRHTRCFCDRCVKLVDAVAGSAQQPTVPVIRRQQDALPGEAQQLPGAVQVVQAEPQAAVSQTTELIASSPPPTSTTTMNDAAGGSPPSPGVVLSAPVIASQLPAQPGPAVPPTVQGD